jgi:hypothetical protein
MSASANSLDGVKGRQQRMWASGDDDAVATRITPLAGGTIGSKVRADRGGIEIRTKGLRDMPITSITVDPGGSFRWHTHPGPVLVAVSKGTLAVYQADGSRCPRSTVTVGLTPATQPNGCHVRARRAR